MKAHLILLTTAFILLLSGCSKEEGCTYPDANNFDPSAEVDDGSCVFDLAADEDEEEESNQSVADSWAGNYLSTESEVGSSDTASSSFTITATSENTVNTNGFNSCLNFEGNVSSTSLVFTNLDDVNFMSCIIYNPIVSRSGNTLTYSYETNSFGNTVTIEGTAVKQD